MNKLKFAILPLLLFVVWVLPNFSYAQHRTSRNIQVPRSSGALKSNRNCTDAAKRWLLSQATADNLILWLDRGITGYGGSAETWSAISGPDFEQNTGANQATLTYESQLMGDVPYFDGSDDYYTIVNLDTDADDDGDPQFGTSYFKLRADGSNAWIDIPGLIDQGGVLEVETLSGTELITNGTFESGVTTGWSSLGLDSGDICEASTTRVSSGSYSAYFNVSASGEGMKQSFTVENGKLYKTTIQYYIESASIRLADGNNILDNLHETYSTTGSWQTAESYDIAVADGSTEIRIIASGGAAEFYVDNVSIQEVTNAGPAQFGLSGTTYVVLAYESTGVSVWGGYTGMQSAHAGAYALGSDLLTNGNFQSIDSSGGTSDFAGWTENLRDGAISGTSITHDGDAAVAIGHHGGNDTDIEQTISCDALRSYELGFFTRGDGTNDGRYRVQYNDGAWANAIPLTDTGVVGTTYTGVSVFFVAPENATQLKVTFRDTDVIGTTCYFDSAYIKEVQSPGTSGTSIYSNQACTTGGSAWQTEGMNFKDVDQLVIYPADLNLLNDFTMIAIIKSDDGQPSSNELILSKYAWQAGIYGCSWSFWHPSNGKISLNTYTDGSSGSEVVDTTDDVILSDGEQTNYTFRAAVKSGTDIDLYHNGVKYDSTSASHTLFDVPTLPTMGSGLAGPFSASRLYDGKISTIIVFDSALTASEIKNIYEVEKYHKGLN